MKKFYLIWVFMAGLSTVVEAQKFDNVWPFGYNSYPSTIEAEAFNLNFDTFPPRVEMSDRPA